MVMRVWLKKGSSWQRVRIAAWIALMIGGSSVALIAEAETLKAQPTLLTRGEVVSKDANDPAATLLNVKDRCGPELPIFLTEKTQVTQGDVRVASSNLAAGALVEVEYSFNVDTSKRHAISVKIVNTAQTQTWPIAGCPSSVGIPVPEAPSIQNLPSSQ